MNSPGAQGAPERHTQTENIHNHIHKETLINVVPVQTTCTRLFAGLWEGDKSFKGKSGKSLPVLQAPTPLFVDFSLDHVPNTFSF